jgi:hypothetical protein
MGVAVFGGVVLAAGPFLPLLANTGQIAQAVWLYRTHQRVLYRLPEDAPDGAGAKIRVVHMSRAQLVPDPGGDGVALRIPSFDSAVREEHGTIVRWRPADPWIVRGEDAERLLARSMARANARGAAPRELDRAFERLAAQEDRAAFLRRLSESEAGLFPGHSQGQPFRMPDVRGGWRRFVGTFRGERVAGTAPPVLRRRLESADALALEMALHEETERRAMEGELKMLEAAWRDAEEIAAIADALPDDPLERMGKRRGE